MQISISLDLDIHESTINYSKDDEHFNLDKTQEALHLFDIEESSNDLHQNNKESLSNADLFPLIQLNNLQLYNPEALSLDEDLSQAPSEDSKTLFPTPIQG